MKTRKEVDDLKYSWGADPCWDIETTEGFEEYREELLAYRLECEAARKIAEEYRLDSKSKRLGCTVELVKDMEFLETQIEQLMARVGRLEEALNDFAGRENGRWSRHYNSYHGE